MSKLAFLFPGQGAQYVGMGKELCATFAPAADLFERAKQVLGFDLLDVCSNGPEEKLTATDISQPAIYVTSLAALEKLKVDDPTAVSNCICTAGLSLGEYTALVFAGAMSFEDGLKVVRQRGQAMQAAALATPSAMASVLGLEAAPLEALCQKASTNGQSVRIANFLCPGNLVVSGTTAAVDQVATEASAAGAMKVIRLSVAGAFHTDLMKPADENLAAAIAGITLQSPRIPVYSNVDAQPHSDPKEIAALLIKQVLNPVRWEDSVRNMMASGAEKFYEIGPGRVLAGLLKRINRKTECVNVGG